MSNIRDTYGIREVAVYKPLGLGEIKAPAVVDSVEVIGIEVEVENFHQRDAGKRIHQAWDVTNDGSLRNNGIEVVSKPIPATFAPVLLQYLFNVYMGAECCFSPRTSVHIHLNVQDLTREQVINLLLLYSVYERLFYKFVGRGRQKNVYCVPLSECNLLNNLAELGETRDGTWSKYTGLNTLPIASYGTIEFRHMHGTTDVAKLSTWINLICALKGHVKRTSTKQIRTAIADMNDGFDFGALMHDIFGVHAGALQYEGPQELTYLSAKQALVSRNVVREFQINMKPSSDFFAFKGN